MDKDPISVNIEGVRQLVGSRLNKTSSSASNSYEGEVGEREDQFTLNLSDEELLELSKTWELRYATYEPAVKRRQDMNKAWYLGKQGEGSYVATNGIGIASNLLFEAVETFIPAALAKNPDPTVWADNTSEGNSIANDVKTMLQSLADTLVFRDKLSEMTRSWCFNFLGVLKHGWDDEIKEIKTEVINPQHLIFSNPEKPVDAYGDYDGVVGERKTCTAKELADMFPRHKAYINLIVDGHMGTEVLYTEWWSDEYCFYTFKGKVLDKSKNPHFNYPKMVPGLDAEGQPVETQQKGSNHFARPRKPYTFLSVFSLGEQPHDVTGLIEQNIPNQNRVSKREMQIDVNLDQANNGLALSEENFNMETGKQAALARRAGRPILVPPGKPISEAIVTLESPGVPEAFFKAAEVDKQDLRSIFGTDGLGATPPDQQKTLGGLLNNEQHDNSRIGGGVGGRLENVAKNTFNWWAQFMHVYYDVPHFAAIMGQMKAVEFVTLQSQSLDRRIIISVTPDSMKPKDEITEMNQAMTLWEQQAIDIKTLLTRLNFPNPSETAAQAWLYHTDPQTYGMLNFPELAQQVQQMQQQQMAQQQQMEAAQGQQQLEQQGAAGQQQLVQKEQSHQQKLSHTEQSFQQKQKMAKEKPASPKPTSSKPK